MKDWNKEFDEKFPICISESMKKFITKLLEEERKDSNIFTQVTINEIKAQCADELEKLPRVNFVKFESKCVFASAIDKLITKWRTK